MSGIWPGRPQEQGLTCGRVAGRPYDLIEEVAKMALDPVCRMEVDPDDPPAVLEHEGHKHYFCSEACKTAFVADPGMYIPGPTCGPTDEACRTDQC